MDNETTVDYINADEEGSLSLSQNNMDVSQSINISYSVPISNVDHVRAVTWTMTMRIMVVVTIKHVQVLW